MLVAAGHERGGAPRVYQDILGNVARTTPHKVAPNRNLPCWSQQGIAGVDEVHTPMQFQKPGEWRSAPPTHQGFSLVPPPFEEASRFEDAHWNIRRGHGSSVVLG